MTYTVLYRGSLRSCNYTCSYCPFASRAPSSRELEQDRQNLHRFFRWIEGQDQHFNIFFTPKGEALNHDWYRKAMVHLSHHPQINKAVIQTNLSCKTDWLRKCNPLKAAFWVSYHPESVPGKTFLQQCMVLYDSSLPFSVGVVGVRKNMDAIARIRRLLPEDVYLWINAYKRTRNYYTTEDIAFLKGIDSLFPFNMHYYKSFGKPCECGQTVFSVDGDGHIRRCHFSETVLGNISTHTLDALSRPSLCENATCHCHIGYVHLKHLNLKRYFGERVLERIRNDE